jgi:hypothetical protein
MEGKYKMKEKNKYQEALDNAVSDIEYCYNDSFEEVPEKRLKEVELLQQLVDKETPKEPIDKGFKNDILQYKCPTCKIGKVGRIIDNGWKTKGEGFTNYCPNCGQKIKW